MANFQQLFLTACGILATVTLRGAEWMAIGYVSVALLKFAVELLLLTAANNLCRHRGHIPGLLIAGGISAGYSALCLIRGFSFLAAPLWRIFIMIVTILVAFGISLSALYRSAVYLLMNAAIGGFSVGFGEKELIVLLIGAICIGVVCVFVSDEGLHSTKVPVELSYGDKRLQLVALRDTGNTLRDPVTGRSVLVIGADSAQELTGLSAQQLKRPAETLCSGIIPGLRLVPYKTIENTGGLLLALNLKNVKIGSWRGNSLVAFAPESIGNGYEALTGGYI